MELVDIYNKDRVQLGYQKEKFAELEYGEFIIIAHIIIFNNNNEMLIQKRTLDKLEWPGYWDISCGGGAIMGENSKECAEREAYEELGIKISLEKERPYITIHYPRGFDDYYLLELNINIEKLEIQKSELTDVRWCSKEEILNMMAEQKFIRYNEGFINMLFSMKDNRGSYLNYGKK